MGTPARAESRDCLSRVPETLKFSPFNVHATLQSTPTTLFPPPPSHPHHAEQQQQQQQQQQEASSFASFSPPFPATANSTRVPRVPAVSPEINPAITPCLRPSPPPPSPPPPTTAAINHHNRRHQR
ncbi:hypothetical protein K0M31_007561 [Melipona bicolor]|uniref:Uncharacterized protein n=1 Tax=Melipona bicolor TaxID=60889 RepID=A0AA40KVS3_9HYME|nr:hypothetical protein K0M31_007561 [Melipona bicolor]